MLNSVRDPATTITPNSQKSTWRASQSFILCTSVLGVFTEIFLFAYIVPILSYMVEHRLNLPPSRIQEISSTILSSYGLVSMISAPIIGHLADKIPNRRKPLLLALTGCLLGTVMIAICNSVWMLFIGRTVQAVFASAGFILSFATLTDNIDSDNLGKALGTATTSMTAGFILGPVVSGALLQLFGYWASWSAPFVLITVGFLARLIMVERSAADSDPSVKPSSGGDEEDPLLQRNQIKNDNSAPHPSSSGFYRHLLSDIRILVGLLNVVVFAIILSAFDSTLPLHLQKLFDWGPLYVGMIYLAVQVPGMILGPLIGWLRDRADLRYPTGSGWILVAVCLCLLGIPDKASQQVRVDDQILFIFSMIGIGIALSLIRGAGTFQLITIIKQLQSSEPLIFGEHGATARVFSITEIAMNLGTIVGPLVAGILVEKLGFVYMVGILSLISLITGALSFKFMSCGP